MPGRIRTYWVHYEGFQFLSTAFPSSLPSLCLARGTSPPKGAPWPMTMPAGAGSGPCLTEGPPLPTPPWVAFSREVTDGAASPSRDSSCSSGSSSRSTRARAASGRPRRRRRRRRSRRGRREQNKGLQGPQTTGTSNTGKPAQRWVSGILVLAVPAVHGVPAVPRPASRPASCNTKPSAAARPQR